jgi:hypothetical protein
MLRFWFSLSCMIFKHGERIVLKSINKLDVQIVSYTTFIS